MTHTLVSARARELITPLACATTKDNTSRYIQVNGSTVQVAQTTPLPDRSKPTVCPTTHCMVPALDCLPPPISASAPNFFLTLVCLHRAKRPLLNQDCIERKLTHLLSNALGDVNSRNGPLSPSGGHRSEGLSLSGPMADTSFTVEVFHTR